MTTTRMIRGLQSNTVCAPYKTAGAECEWASLPSTTQCEYVGLHYIALDEIFENDKEVSRLSLQDVLFGLWGILFSDRGKETYRRLEGDDMTPITAYKSGKHYIVAGGDNRLATARYLGQSFVLAEVWELP